MRVFHYSEAFLVVKLVEPQKLENSRASHFRSFPPFSVIFSGGSNILAAMQSALDYTGGTKVVNLLKLSVILPEQENLFYVGSVGC